MTDSLNPLETNLRHLPDSELVLSVEVLVEKGIAHPKLQNVPEDVPGPVHLDAAKTRLATSAKAVGTPEYNEAEHEEARTVLLEYCIMWGQYIVMRAKMRNDPSVLKDTGFADKKAPVRTSTASKGPTPVPKAKVKRGESGEFIFILDGIPLNGTYEMRYTTDPEFKTWTEDKDQSPYCRFRRGGFIPGTKYYFSFRFHGPNGTSEWSAPIGIYATEDD